jgi:hypothetical protein
MCYRSVFHNKPTDINLVVSTLMSFLTYIVLCMVKAKKKVMSYKKQRDLDL